MSFLALSRPSACFYIKTSKRCLSTVPPIELNFDVYGGLIDPQVSNGPLLIAHGLFGSKRNWTSLGKTLAKRLQRPVVPLDLRNSGDSPHSDVMDYRAQASDILHFCDKHSLKNISLLGHSMGGKAAMAFALNPDLPEGLLSHLIVADISPIQGRLSSEFPRYVEGMLKLQNEIKPTSKKEAFDALHSYEPDVMIRHFLLTNLAPTSNGEPVKFRVPLETIKNSLGDIGDFPYKAGETSWNGPTLFIKGEKSNYIKMKNIDLMRQFFPNMKLETLDAGHWVHYEQPKDFVDFILRFIEEN